MSKSRYFTLTSDNIVGNNGYYSINKKIFWRNSYLLHKTIKLYFIFESVF
jgi:hypothetical protein